MVPAQQRLEAGELVRGKAGDRLVEHRDLLPLERLAQIAFERQLALVLAAHARRLKISMRSAPPRLARSMAISPSRSRSCAVGLRPVVHDDADRGGEHDLLAADLHRRAQRAAHPLGKRRHLVRVGLGDQQDGELVAAETRERVLRVEMAARACAPSVSSMLSPTTRPKLLLTFLKRSMSMNITVGRLHLPFAGAGDGALQAIEEQLAVGQAGQAVMHRVVHQPLMRALEVGDVAHQADAAQAAAYCRSALRGRGARTRDRCRPGAAGGNRFASSPPCFSCSDHSISRKRSRSAACMCWRKSSTVVSSAPGSSPSACSTSWATVI